MKNIINDKELVSRGHVLTLRFIQYFNGRLAVVAEESGESYGTLSINMPDVEMGPDEFCVKNYSENKELAKDAWETGYFEDTGKVVQSGYVVIPIWRVKNE